jgi:glycosyltransferase involved in cell wall biosynthesis
MTGHKAKSTGARYVCDRGSAHIRVQDRILREEYDRLSLPFRGIDPRIIDREEAEYAAADAITVPSTFALRSFEHEGVSSSKLHLVPYGVDLSKFRPVAKPDVSTFDVLFVGTASVQKGIHYLIESFDLVQHPRKKLTLVGGVSSELKTKLLSLTSKRTDIVVVGHVPQSSLSQYMSRAHVMVLPSVQEGMALVQAQAMACGCPVIGTTSTGAEDLFTHGVEGFIVEPRNPEAIARSLQKFVDDKNMRDKMGMAALAKVKKIGGWDLYGDKMYSLFNNIAANRPNSSR